MSNHYRSITNKKTNPYQTLLTLFALTVLTVFGLKFFAPNLSPKVAEADTQKTQTSQTTGTKEKTEVTVTPLKATLTSTTPSSATSTTETSTETPVAEETTAVTTEAADETVLEEQITETGDVVQVAVATTAHTSYTGVLSNGNTAGAIGTEAAAKMAAATGVPQETWEYIIARESNGDPNVANASGAAGLFQTMPGWGSTATVEDQINTAIKAYNNQGLAAWGMQ